MSGNDAKIILNGVLGMLKLASIKDDSVMMDTFVRQFSDAVRVASDAIDMAEDRLEVDNGDK